MVPESVILSISDIKEIGFAMQILPNDYDPQKLAGGLGFSFDIDEEKNLLIITPAVSYTYNDDDNKSIEVIKYTTKIVFGVDNIKAHITRVDDDKVRIHQALVYLVLNLSLSTLRGMLAVKTIGQPHPIIIPILHLPDMVKHLFAGNENEVIIPSINSTMVS